MIDASGARPVDRARLRHRALPLAVLGCWLVWATLAWWTAPRSVDAADLERDLAAGRVVTLARAAGWEDRGPWGRRPEPRYAQHGSTVVWARPDGQFRYAYVPAPVPQGGSVEDATDPGPVTDPGPATEPGPGQEADPLADSRARAAVTRHGDSLADTLADAAALLALTIGVGWLLMLVAGPPPVAGSRWYWFWIGLLPYALGVLAWAWRERWRAEAPVTGTRGSGWRGFGGLVVGGILVSMAVAVLGILLGGYVVPGG
ncbi:hypothetical protein ACIBP4_28890 [Micromonospora maritima]|uniref:Uncharacterized protein n=1 Tax=Micromonospora maritima TaxID=986711 RepID=A0ABW7ZUR6_9ACTN